MNLIHIYSRYLTLKLNILIIFLIVIIISLLYNYNIFEKINKRTLVYLNNYYKKILTYNLFSEYNLMRTPNYKFKIDVCNFIKIFNKLSNNHKYTIKNYFIKNFKTIDINYITNNDNIGFVYPIKKLSYNDKNKFEDFLASFGLLTKIYNITNESTKLLMKTNHIPKKHIINDFIDIAKLLENNNDEKLNSSVAKLISYTEYNNNHQDTKIKDCMSFIYHNKTFKNLINNYLNCNRIKFKFPMPNKFNKISLNLLSEELSKHEYIDNKYINTFINLFTEGIDEHSKIIMNFNNKYQFNYFILELYDVSFHKLDNYIKNNVQNIFFNKKNKPLKLYNLGNNDYNEKRKKFRNTIKSIINNCLNFD